MAHPDEYRAARELQKSAAARGEPLSFGQALAAVRNPREDLSAINMARIFERLEGLDKRVGKVEGDIDGIHVTGQGHDGHGKDGMRFNLPPQQFPDTMIVITNDGGEKEVAKAATRAGTTWTLAHRTIKAGSNVTVSQETDTVTINAAGEGTGDTVAVTNEGGGEGQVLDFVDLSTPGFATIVARSLAIGSYISIVTGDEEVTFTGATVETNNLGNVDGQVLTTADFADMQWTINARGIKAGTYTIVSQDATDITVEGALVYTTNVASGEPVLKDIFWNAVAHQWEITGRPITVAASQWITIATVADVITITCNIPDAPESGGPFFLSVSDGVAEWFDSNDCAPPPP